jgi:hypothetical protein
MITASPGVITAGAASGLLVARAARGLDASGGYALFAASAARGAVFLVNGVRPAPRAGLVSGCCTAGWARWRHNAL